MHTVNCHYHFQCHHLLLFLLLFQPDLFNDIFASDNHVLLVFLLLFWPVLILDSSSTKDHILLVFLLLFRPVVMLDPFATDDHDHPVVSAARFTGQEKPL